MAVWVPIAFGALDLRSHEFAEQGYDLLVVPTLPQEPLFLFGDGADLWRNLITAPVDDAGFDERKLGIIREFAESGLASNDLEHPARARALEQPWMESAIHEIIYALLANVAKSIAINIVFIKGPTLHAQGLRQRAHSGDVDCWVSPGDEVRLAEAMRAWGWTPMISAFTGTSVAHSLTLSAGSWGCEIDVHTRFPGVTADPEEAFDLVLSGSEMRGFAGVECLTPSIYAHAILLALHEVRPVGGAGPSDSGIEAAVSALRAAGPTTTIIAGEFGAEYALGASLAAAFPGLEIDVADAVSPPEWSWRVHGSTARGLVMALRSLPIRQRPKVLRRLLFPGRAVMLASGRLSNESRSLLGVYVRRFGGAVRSLLQK